MTLPSPQVHTPTIYRSDFDSDGINDVIVYTSAAIIGYRVVYTSSLFPLYIPLLIVVFVAVVVFFSKLQYDTGAAAGTTARTTAGTTAGTSAGAGRQGKRSRPSLYEHFTVYMYVKHE